MSQKSALQRWACGGMAGVCLAFLQRVSLDNTESAKVSTFRPVVVNRGMAIHCG